MTAPNIVDVALIRGQSSVTRQVGTETQVIVFNEPSSSKVFKINSIVVTNVDGTNSADITVDITKSNAPYAIVSTVAVPADSSLVVLSKETSIYLEESMAIRATASANDDLYISISYEEIGETVDSDSLKDYENFHPYPLNLYDWWAITSSATSSTISSDGATGKSPLAGLPLKMSVTGTDPHIGTYNNSNYNIAPAADGETWGVSVWCKASTATTMQLYIFGADSGGSWSNLQPTGGVIVATDFSVTTSWVEYSTQITFNNPGVAYIQARLDGPESGGTGQDLWFDYMKVYKIS